MKQLGVPATPIQPVATPALDTVFYHFPGFACKLLRPTDFISFVQGKTGVRLQVGKTPQPRNSRKMLIRAILQSYGSCDIGISNSGEVRCSNGLAALTVVYLDGRHVV